MGHAKWRDTPGGAAERTRAQSAGEIIVAGYRIAEETAIGNCPMGNPGLTRCNGVAPRVQTRLNIDPRNHHLPRPTFKAYSSASAIAAPPIQRDSMPSFGM